MRSLFFILSFVPGIFFSGYAQQNIISTKVEKAIHDQVYNNLNLTENQKSKLKAIWLEFYIADEKLKEERTRSGSGWSINYEVQASTSIRKDKDGKLMDLFTDQQKVIYENDKKKIFNLRNAESRITSPLYAKLNLTEEQKQKVIGVWVEYYELLEKIMLEAEKSVVTATPPNRMNMAAEMVTMDKCMQLSIDTDQKIIILLNEDQKKIFEPESKEEISVMQKELGILKKLNSMMDGSKSEQELEEYFGSNEAKEMLRSIK